MKITIIGAGGVGGYFGAKLIQAGYDVSFLARGKHLEAMKHQGLQILSFMGDFHTSIHSASDKIAELPQADLIILALKTWQVAEVAPHLSPIVHVNTVFLCLQNGVSIPYELAEIYPQHCVLGGVCKIISKIHSPGIILHQGVKPQIVFGCIKNENKAIEQRVKEAFDKSGIDGKISEDIEADLWKKFIGICLGGLLVTNKCTYGELVSKPAYRKQMVGLLNEIFGLSKVIGVNLRKDFVLRLIPIIESFPPDSKSSMARDMEAGLPSELDYQNGTVVRLGKKHQFPTPINDEIYRSLVTMEQEARNTI